MYNKNARVVLLVIDLTRFESLQALRRYCAAFEGNSCLKREQVIVYVVGNKSDLVELREVPQEEIDEFCSSIEAPYFEVSAKSGGNVFELFNHICDQFQSAGENIFELNLPKEETLKSDWQTENLHVTKLVCNGLTQRRKESLLFMILSLFAYNVRVLYRCENNLIFIVFK